MFSSFRNRSRSSKLVVITLSWHVENGATSRKNSDKQRIRISFPPSCRRRTSRTYFGVGLRRIASVSCAGRVNRHKIRLRKIRGQCNPPAHALQRLFATDVLPSTTSFSPVGFVTNQRQGADYIFGFLLGKGGR